MAKSISLAFDHSKVYLTNNNEVTFSYSLAGNGIYIGLLAGELSVTYASTSPPSGTPELIENPLQIGYRPGSIKKLYVVGEGDEIFGRIIDLGAGDVANLYVEEGDLYLVVVS